MKSELMRLDWISKGFEHNPLLKYVNLTIYAGEIHALMGLNGVGKSTLLQIIAGQTAPSGGRIWFQGQPVKFSDSFDANALGIYALETVPEIVPQLDLAENVALWIHGKRRGFFDSAAAHRYTRQLLEEFELTGIMKDTAPGHSLTVLGRKIANILCALACHVKLLLMDEPFSVLDAMEAVTFKKILRHVQKRGVTILFTSHSFQNACDIADRISILRAGHCAATMDNPGDLTQLLAMAVPVLNGGAAEDAQEETLPTAGREIFRVDVQKVPGLATPLRFCVHAGEIMGIVNAGPIRQSVCESLFGLSGRVRGSYLIEGKPVSVPSPSAAIDAGIGCASDSVHYQDLVPQLTCAQNITLPFLHRLFPGRLVAAPREEYVAEQYLDFLNLGEGRTLSSASYDLSAGMQKRLSLARWLSMPLKVLMLNEPFKNLDPRGRAELTAILRRKAAEGVAVMVELSNFGELSPLCSQVLVINNNRVVGTVSAPHITPQRILSMLLPDSEPEG